MDNADACNPDVKSHKIEEIDLEISAGLFFVVGEVRTIDRFSRLNYEEKY